MLILSCQLAFESLEENNIKRVLYSIVFDYETLSFYKIKQNISVELTQELSSKYTPIDIYDVVSMKYANSKLDESEVRKLELEILNDGILKYQKTTEKYEQAKEFLTSYIRDKKIKYFLNE